MEVTATDAKNRFGQMIEHSQREPVVIEKSGRRCSVLLSADRYDALVLASQQHQAPGATADAGNAFYQRHKEWVDHLNAQVEERGLWNDDLRVW